jgi:N-acetylmuramoyl-L-alanine amidase
MKRLQNKASSLKIRATPSGADTGLRIVSGEVVDAHGASYDGTWTYVAAKAGAGWASTAFLGPPAAAPPPPVPAPSKGILVCVDAGHGGHDSGAVSAAGVTEKALALVYAQDLRATLVGAGHRVVMTRDKDEFIPLAGRSAFSNEHRAECFISVHLNAADSKLANGAWVIHDDNSGSGPGSGKALATAIFRRMRDVPGVADADAAEEVFPDDSPPVGNRDLAVLGGTRAPAVLVELGFLTNEEDFGALSTSGVRMAVVRAIAAGVQDWLAARK